MESGTLSFRVFPGTAADAPLAVLIGEAEGDALAAALQAEKDVSLACIGGMNWNRDLSPWPAPAPFPGQPPFEGGAEAFLETLTAGLLPAVRKELPGEPRWIALAGYSLAGLFAAWAALRSPLFSRFASISGSLWYPGFSDWLRAAPGEIEKAYFSLGDREARTRNPALKSVEEAARAAAECLSARGAETVFHLNPGNHFYQTEERIVRGILWLLQE